MLRRVLLAALLFLCLAPAARADGPEARTYLLFEPWR
jgi:hypothetical protein